MRRRLIPHSLCENLELTKWKYETELTYLADSHERDAVIQKIAQIENVKRMDGWLLSKLRAPA